MAAEGTIKVGDTVTTTATKNYDNSKTLASWVRGYQFNVIQVNGDRVVIGKGQAVTAAVNISTLTKIGGEPEPVVTPEVPPVDETQQEDGNESVMTADQMQSELLAIMQAGNADDILRYNMRLFGIPHQFTPYCDYRSYSNPKKTNKAELIGRKFIENIMLEAPVVTIIPGKPRYLPNSKNKRGTSQALLAAANGSLADAVNVQAILQDKNLNEKLRYYDFEQDYLHYMSYVDILCGVSAAFLDIQDVELDGVKLAQYEWKNYRWNTESYKSSVGKAAAFGLEVASGLAQTIKNYGQAAVEFIGNAVTGGQTENGNTEVTALSREDQKDLREAIEDIMTSANFVQFYVDPASSVNESASNATTSSKLEEMFTAGQDLIREVAFIANSGGIDPTEAQEFINASADNLNEKIFGTNQGPVFSVVSRLLSGLSNVIKGDQMVIPKIYQSSEYSRSYSITIDLRAPLGNKLSYFLNVLVPLFHLLALAIPRQSTANTYGAPFLVKAFFPGIFSCNLGIVRSITIDKNSTAESWTVDGYPNEMKVRLEIEDLYSELSMSPANDIILFLANSSLIDYLATTCGVNLTIPQLSTRVRYNLAAIKQAFGHIDDSVFQSTFNGLESVITSFLGV